MTQEELESRLGLMEFQIEDALARVANLGYRLLEVEGTPKPQTLVPPDKVLVALCLEVDKLSLMMHKLLDRTEVLVTHREVIVREGVE